GPGLLSTFGLIAARLALDRLVALVVYQLQQHGKKLLRVMLFVAHKLGTSSTKFSIELFRLDHRTRGRGITVLLLHLLEQFAEGIMKSAILCATVLQEVSTNFI